MLGSHISKPDIIKEVKIGQQEIYEFLSKNKGKKFLEKEIEKELGINESNCCRGLMILCKQRFIKREFIEVEYKKQIKVVNNLKKKVRRYWV